MPRSGYVYIFRQPSQRDAVHRRDQRIWRHRQGMGSGFTAQYGVTRLVYYEAYDDMQTAIEREKTVEGLVARLED